MKEKNNTDLSDYRVGQLTLLQLMAILAAIGIAATWVVQRLFFTN